MFFTVFFCLDVSIFCFVLFSFASSAGNNLHCKWNIIHVTLSIWWSRFIFISLAPLEHWTWIFSILELAKANRAETRNGMCDCNYWKREKKQMNTMSHRRCVIQFLQFLQCSLSHANYLLKTEEKSRKPLIVIRFKLSG